MRSRGRRCQPWHLRWIFPLVPESTYEGAVGSAICLNSDPYNLILVYRFLSKDLWIFSGWCGGYPTWDSSMICGASAICLDLMSVRIFWKDSEDPGGACLSPSYTSNWLFSESRPLAIIGSPWPMTLAPTNEAIRNETSGKKTLSVKVKNDWLAGLSCNRCKDKFYQKW